ncbi:MAG: hypothetical protein AB7S26_27780 [Sandaracinaceae bacterium]
MDRRPLALVSLLAAGSFGGLWLLAHGRSGAEATATEHDVTPAPTRGRHDASFVVPHLDARWMVIGGGPTPEYNQVQLEQDVALAIRALRPIGDGVVLFAGGPHSHAVQVLREDAPPVDLRARLGELFDPRLGRDAHYRATELEPLGPATREAILEALRGALGESEHDPLTAYFAGHGIGGDTPLESRYLTWANDELSVEDLSALFDESGEHRPVRLVMTSCYAGGFAELAFDGADPDRGAARSVRCGFFATSWDRAAAGCDPSPDRGAQEGYGIHFLHALLAEDRAGASALGRIDLDGDGAVSLLEAHTRARIASRSIDVPVTTSERFLRAFADPERPPRPEGSEPALPEELAVIDALGRELELADRAAAEAALEEVDREIDERAEELEAIDEEIVSLHATLTAELLHRWPVLDDPWHPDFDDTLARDGDAIEAHLADSAAAGGMDDLEVERERVANLHDDALVRSARVERLLSAYETVDLASRLAGEGGLDWLRYQALLACERGAP